VLMRNISLTTLWDAQSLCDPHHKNRTNPICLQKRVFHVKYNYKSFRYCSNLIFIALPINPAWLVNATLSRYTQPLSKQSLPPSYPYSKDYLDPLSHGNSSTISVFKRSVSIGGSYYNASNPFCIAYTNFLSSGVESFADVRG
jgi:hypothetical protein